MRRREREQPRPPRRTHPIPRPRAADRTERVKTPHHLASS
jgi:hypothetical protein